MANHPAERVIANQPFFYNVVLDCFGPIEVKSGRSTHKRYGIIFTCQATRAIQLDIYYSIDTSSFINALSRFVSKRGKPATMVCDKGTNFIGGKNKLEACLKDAGSSKLETSLLKQGIAWKFNPPASPHMGDSYERLIRSVKSIL